MRETEYIQGFYEQRNTGYCCSKLNSSIPKQLKHFELISAAALETDAKGWRKLYNDYV